MTFRNRCVFCVACLFVLVASAHHQACAAPLKTKKGKAPSTCTMTRCGCADGRIPLLQEDVHGGTYHPPEDHLNPGAIHLQPRMMPPLIQLNKVPPYQGFLLEEKNSFPQYFLDRIKTAKLCQDLSDTPWKFKVGGTFVCENDLNLDALDALCHEFGHSERCGDHNHSSCEDECAQYMRGLSLGQKCRNDFLIRSNLAGMSVTCGSSSGMCTIGGVDTKGRIQKGPGSCFDYCVAALRQDALGANGGAVVSRIQETRNASGCERFVKTYSPHCIKSGLMYCGDGTCQGHESPTTCPLDCKTVCGDGVCSHGESASSCLKDCCTPYGKEVQEGRPCCPEAPTDSDVDLSPPMKAPRVYQYGKVCSSCAPFGEKPQGDNSCCGNLDHGMSIIDKEGRCMDCQGENVFQDDTTPPCCTGLKPYQSKGPRGNLVNLCQSCAHDGQRPAQGHDCCRDEELEKRDGLCRRKNPCAEFGEKPSSDKPCCRGLGIQKGLCANCVGEGGRVNTDPRIFAPSCCDGLKPTAQPDGTNICAKAMPESPTTGCLQKAQPCNPQGQNLCCQGCALSTDGAYRCL